MSNTSEWKFKDGDCVFDDIQNEQIKIIGRYEDFGVNCYECKMDSGAIVYRKESELI